jgi:nicotinamide-nucleotide amidase
VTGGDVAGLAGRLIQAAVAHGVTVATAESLTGGSVSAALVSVPGASNAFRGGVVSYSTDLKGDWLGVPRALLEARGAVDPDVARAMAAGVRRRASADVGLATTGVAGPGPTDGHPAGTVHVAVATAAGEQVRSLLLAGDRDAVRAGATAAVLALALDALGDAFPPQDRHT